MTSHHVRGRRALLPMLAAAVLMGQLLLGAVGPAFALVRLKPQGRAGSPAARP